MILPPKADCEPQRYIKEFRLDKPAEHKVGAMLTASEVFKDIKRVDVIGTTKGRGFTGVMKWHNFGACAAATASRRVRGSTAGSLQCQQPR